MKRSLTALTLACLLLLPCALADANPPDDFVQMTVPLLFTDYIPADVDKINAAVNEITRDAIGCEINLVPLLYFTSNNVNYRRQAELNYLAKDGLTLDLFNYFVGSGQAMPMENLLEQYGQGILNSLDIPLSLYRESDGHIYKLPFVNRAAMAVGVVMRTDILERHHIDVSGIYSWADLDELFAHLLALEPELALICGHSTSQALNNHVLRSVSVQNTYFCLSPDDPDTLMYVFETDAYREEIAYARKWYEAGYTLDDMAIQTVYAQSLVKAGRLFAYFQYCNPASAQEESARCGMPMTVIPLSRPILSPTAAYTYCWSISAGCAHPDKAMQFLNLLSTDARLVNLMLNGIEGEHYVLLPDGTIDDPPGADTLGYANAHVWQFPNPSIGYLRADSVSYKQARLDFYQSADLSPLLGFFFDDSAVRAEQQAVNQVIDQYYYGLGTGQLDPAVYLPRMLSQMDSTGAGKVREEIQRQYAEWRASKEEQP